MARFTTDNTEGFQPDDLDALNEAYDTLMARDAQPDDYGYDDDTDDTMAFLEKHISDRLNNVWQPGMDAPALVAAYDRHGGR
jgi:hypothetical protein